MLIRNSKSIGFMFILVVLLIYPLPQIAIDIYLPSWPSLLNIFDVTRSSLQLTLSIYILFLGMAQLFYGPCSDKFGRKPVLLFGCSLFVLASIAIMFVTSIWQLMLLRAVQGLGIGCGFAVASAILADTFTGKKLAKMTTYSSMIYSLAVIFAPFFGSYLQYYIGWRANFGAMALYGIILVMFIYIFVGETNERLDHEALLPKKITKNYLSLLSNICFSGNVVCISAAYGIMVAFSIISPFLLQTLLHVSVISYGELISLVGLSYFAGTTANSFLLKWLDVKILVILGFVCIFFASGCLAIVGAIGWFSPLSVTLFTCITIFGIGFVFPNCFSNALEVSPEKGVSGALIGSVVLIGSSITTFFVVHAQVNSEFGLSIVYLALAVFSFASYMSSNFFTKISYNNKNNLR